jgi:hypothetical protein
MADSTEHPKGLKEVYGGLLDEHRDKLQILRPVEEGMYEDV